MEQEAGELIEVGIILTKYLTLPIVAIFVIVSICSAMQRPG